MKRTIAAIALPAAAAAAAAAALVLAGCTSTASSTDTTTPATNTTSAPAEDPETAFVRKHAKEIDGRDLDTIVARQQYSNAVLGSADAACDSFEMAEEDGVIDLAGADSTTRYYLRRTSESIASGSGSSAADIVKGWGLSTEFQCPRYSPMIAAYQAQN